jgi:IS5 family transposase
MAMIVDRYDPMNLFALVPQLRLEMEPELAGLDRLLADDVVFQRVKADLACRYPNSLRLGRHSTPVEVILRMLVVRRLYDWSYEQTERFVNDSLVLRQFCRLYLAAAPDDTTLIRWAKLIGLATLDDLHEHIVGLARGLRVTRGRKLRTDGTVVETTIHHPSDSSLLRDGVRVVSRLLRRAQAVVGTAVTAGGELFRDRTRSATRLARQIGEAARRRGSAAEEAHRATYRRLVAVAAASLRQATAVQEALASRGEAGAVRLRQQMGQIVPLVEQVIRQTRRRVVAGEAVPATEKLVSLFEPHTCIIRRGKVRQPTEFGRKVWLDEVEGGIISRYAVLAGNPADAQQGAPSLTQHRRLFGRPPTVFATDRGGYSAANERLAQQAGVAYVALPQPGAKSPARVAHEQQRWFRRAQRFRAGGEGRISVLKRRGSLGRCRDKGEDGFRRWIGWGVITANLRTIARAVATRA